MENYSSDEESSDSEDFDCNESEDEMDESEEDENEWKDSLLFSKTTTPNLKEEPRLKSNLKWNHPIDAFTEFLSDEVLEKIKTESNRYGKYKLKNFVDTTVQEWKYFFLSCYFPFIASIQWLSN